VDWAGEDVPREDARAFMEAALLHPSCSHLSGLEDSLYDEPISPALHLVYYALYHRKPFM
jgi:hypothetical protein